MRRKLFAFNVSTPTPTWKLNPGYIKKFDFTNQTVEPNFKQKLYQTLKV